MAIQKPKKPNRQEPERKAMNRDRKELEKSKHTVLINQTALIFHLCFSIICIHHTYAASNIFKSIYRIGYLLAIKLDGYLLYCSWFNKLRRYNRNWKQHIDTFAAMMFEILKISEKKINQSLMVDIYEKIFYLSFEYILYSLKRHSVPATFFCGLACELNSVNFWAVKY